MAETRSLIWLNRKYEFRMIVLLIKIENLIFKPLIAESCHYLLIFWLCGQFCYALSNRRSCCKAKCKVQCQSLKTDAAQTESSCRSSGIDVAVNVLNNIVQILYFSKLSNSVDCPDFSFSMFTKINFYCLNAIDSCHWQNYAMFII